MRKSEKIPAKFGQNLAKFVKISVTRVDFTHGSRGLLAMSSNWWDEQGRGPNRDWRNQKGWGKTRPGPYEGKHRIMEDISEDEEIQRPKKGKGKKPQEKKREGLPELNWR